MDLLSTRPNTIQVHHELDPGGPQGCKRLIACYSRLRLMVAVQEHGAGVG